MAFGEISLAGHGEIPNSEKLLDYYSIIQHFYLTFRILAARSVIT